MAKENGGHAKASGGEASNVSSDDPTELTAEQWQKISSVYP
jgi:hypothetical protein